MGSFFSFSKEKETKDCAASFSFVSSRSPCSLFLFLPPRDPDSSLLLLRAERRGQGSSAFFSEEKEMEDRAALVSFAPLLSSSVSSASSSPSFCLFFAFLSYSLLL